MKVSKISITTNVSTKGKEKVPKVGSNIAKQIATMSPIAKDIAPFITAGVVVPTGLSQFAGIQCVAPLLNDGKVVISEKQEEEE